MNHVNTPSSNYDLAKVASILGRYSAQCTQDSRQQLNVALEQAIDGILSCDKPAVPHNGKDLIKSVRHFLHHTIVRLLNTNEMKLPPDHFNKVSSFVERYESELVKINENDKRIWNCDPSDIENLFGIAITGSQAREAIDEERRKWSHYSISKVPESLERTVTLEEAEGLSQIVRSNLFNAVGSEPFLYLDDPAKHYLFWMPTQKGAECVVPENYALSTYLRFHCPHNDAHLFHLSALRETGKGVMNYLDKMDERSFFEAAAVHAEWQMFEKVKNDENFVLQLYFQLLPAHRKNLTLDEFRVWLLQSRGYEFRLRLVRLLGDFFSLKGTDSFDEIVRKSAKICGTSIRETEAEIKKYYHFPGLGATYTLGYRKFVENGVTQIQDAVIKDEEMVRTWHQYNY